MIFHCHCMGHVYIASTLITPLPLNFYRFWIFSLSVLSWRLKELLKKFKEPSLESSLTHLQLPGSRLCKRRKVDSGSAAQSLFCSIRINRRKYTQLCHAFSLSLSRSFISINFVDIERSRWIHLVIWKIGLKLNWEASAMILQNIYDVIVLWTFIKLTKKHVRNMGILQYSYVIYISASLAAL